MPFVGIRLTTLALFSLRLVFIPASSTTIATAHGRLDSKNKKYAFSTSYLLLHSEGRSDIGTCLDSTVRKAGIYLKCHSLEGERYLQYLDTWINRCMRAGSWKQQVSFYFQSNLPTYLFSSTAFRCSSLCPRNSFSAGWRWPHMPDLIR